MVVRILPWLECCMYVLMWVLSFIGSQGKNYNMKTCHVKIFGKNRDISIIIFFRQMTNKSQWSRTFVYKP